MRTHRLRLRWVIPFAMAAIGMLVVSPAANANTPNVKNGCEASTTAGAELGHYPAWPGDQSYLRVACIFSHTPQGPAGPGDFVSPTFTIHDFANVTYHNGAGRTMTANVAAAA